jgi:hypothetical protein
VAEVLTPGTRVEVRIEFDGRWSKGFEVDESVGGGYVLRRLSDGSVLPRTFPSEVVRRERRDNRWWI